MRAKAGPDRARGFTLIEVIGALVVFAVGVLMVVNLTGVLSLQMRTAGVRSAVSVAVWTRLDSLQALPYDSLQEGTREDTLMILGRPYRRTEIVLRSTALVKEAQVTVQPIGSTGPNQTASIFVLRPWP